MPLAAIGTLDLQDSFGVAKVTLWLKIQPDWAGGLGSIPLQRETNMEAEFWEQLKGEKCASRGSLLSNKGGVLDSLIYDTI